MDAARLELIDISLIDDHPDNPRIAYRDDVVDAIAENLNGEFPQKHAVHLRPVGERYQLVAGHHRKRAALKKGITQLPAWVEELDDDAAFMELALSNNQGELSPLEIGLHALRAVPTAKGGRGKKGGLSEYAAKLGRTQQVVSQYRQAAAVLQSLGKPTSQLVSFLDKAQHLSAIHSLPESCWLAAVNAIGNQSAADVRQRVEQAKEFYESHGIAERWTEEYLSPEVCCALVFAGTDPNNFRRLADLAQRVFDDLAERGHGDLAKDWELWLITHAQGESFEIKSAQAKRIELEQSAYDRENTETVDRDEVTVLLADPPWQYDFAETDNRQIENQYPTASADEIGTHIKLPWVPPLADDCVLFMWATAPKLREAFAVMDAWGFTYKTHAIWDKERVGMGYWFRGQHELLLVGTRGNASPPEADKRFSSVFREKRDSKHSKKPACVYKALEEMFPSAVRFEMYQREPKEGWSGGGNEART